MIDGQHYTPISIVLGGTLIGAGLFFGLRERGASARVELPVLEVGAGRAGGAASLETAAPAGTARVPARRAVDLNAARRAAEQALELQRAAVVASCIPAESMGGNASRLRINVTFDANGKQIGRGIIPEHNDPRRQLAACATGALSALAIPAENAPATLNVVWALP